MFSRTALLPFVAAMLLTGGCTAIQPLPTPTGNPEVTVHSTDVNRIKGEVVAIVAVEGYTLRQDTPYSMVFTKPLNGGGAALYQAALGNAYSSAPQWHVALTFAPAADGTRVFAHVSISMANAFGREDQTNVDHGKAGREWQAALEHIKASVEAKPARR